MTVNILALESSCDETSASINRDGRVLSNTILSQSVHELYGGVVPELASRAHQQHIISVVSQALRDAKIILNDINAIAFTRGPGLLASHTSRLLLFLVCRDYHSRSSGPRDAIPFSGSPACGHIGFIECSSLLRDFPVALTEDLYESLWVWAETRSPISGADGGPEFKQSGAFHRI